jgi:hypothetical protein
MAEIQAITPSIPYLQQGNMTVALQSLAHEHLYVWTGMESGLFGTRAGNWSYSRFAATYAPIIIGAIMSRYLGRYVNPTLRKLPIIGGKVRL